MSDSVTGGTLRLSCQPSKVGNLLIFPYTVANPGPDDAYVMHALPSINPTSGEARANETAAVVIADDSGDAIIGKFVTPLPTDRHIAVPVFPLARRVPAGASLEGRIEIPLPLAETSPYFPDLTLRGYEIFDIKGVQLMIGYWPTASGDLVVRETEYAPDLLTVLGADLAGRAGRVSRRFPTTGLQLFKRTDAFPRTLGSTV